MGRASTALVIAAALCLLAPAPVGSTSSPPTARPNPTWAEFRLKLDDGFRLLVEARDGKVTLRVRRRLREASYSVPGTASMQGVKAHFGRLGRIAVEFRPDRLGGLCRRHVVAS